MALSEITKLTQSILPSHNHSLFEITKVLIKRRHHSQRSQQTDSYVSVSMSKLWPEQSAGLETTSAEKRAKVPCIERRKRETRALRAQIEQLQLVLDSLTCKRQTASTLAQDQWENQINFQIGAKARARRRNTRLQRAIDLEKKRSLRLTVLLRKMIAPMKVTTCHSVFCLRYWLLTPLVWIVRPQPFLESSHGFYRESRETKPFSMGWRGEFEQSRTQECMSGSDKLCPWTMTA